MVAIRSTTAPRPPKMWIPTSAPSGKPDIDDGEATREGARHGGTEGPGRNGHRANRDQNDADAQYRLHGDIGKRDDDDRAERGQ